MHVHKKCNFCKKIGHLERVCRKKSETKIHHVDQMSDCDSDDMPDVVPLFHVEVSTVSVSSPVHPIGEFLHLTCSCR